MDNFQRRLVPSTASLAAFDAVARLGSFSAAATAMHLTPGAVSRQIATLEEQLDAVLLVRTNKGVELTAKGAVYARHLADVMTKIRMMSLEAMAKNPPGVLSLAMLPTFGTRWLLPRIPDFVSRFPDITLNLATRIGVFDFEAEGLDAAIHVGKPDWPGCECHLLMRETVVPVCSPEFLARNPVASPEALLSVPLLEMASRPGAWQHWFASLNVREPYLKGMRFEQMMNVSQACCAGLGVALMPLFLIRNEMNSGQLVKAFDWTVESPGGYYFVHPIRSQAQISVMRFLNWLSEKIAAADFS